MRETKRQSLGGPPDDGLRVIACPGWLNAAGLVHGATLRAALPEPGRGDLFAAIRRAREAGVLPGGIAIGADQVHGTRVQVIDAPIDPAHQPRGYRTDPPLGACEFPETDALATDIPGLLLVIRTADCLPLFALDRRRRAVGLAHCGWRGLLGGIAEGLARSLVAMGSDPAGIEAWFGPCIRAPRYEVGEELVGKFGRAYPGCEPSPDGRRLDLAAVARRQLEQAGVAAERIHDCGECTYEGSARYHSYRREGEAAGRMLSFIGFDVDA